VCRHQFQNAAAARIHPNTFSIAAREYKGGDLPATADDGEPQIAVVRNGHVVGESVPHPQQVTTYFPRML
jgi:hypothetical protein